MHDSQIAVSLDGPTPETHDAFRRVRGSYAWTMRIVEAAIGLDLPLQINSTTSRLTLPYLESMARRVGELPVTLWALFFLIQTGRGAGLEQISADERERVLTFLYDLSLTAPFGIKTTEAPHYHRVVWQREHEAGGAADRTTRRKQLRAPRSVNDGSGFVFVDHLGNNCPSGFLLLHPATCGPRTWSRSTGRTRSSAVCAIRMHCWASAGDADSARSVAAHSRGRTRPPAP